jgi:hypothetical protein
MNRLATRMRPKTHIDLIRVKQLGYHGRCTVQHRSHVRGFCSGEVSDVNHVTSRLDDQRPHPERADTMLHSKVLGLKDAAARRLASPLSQTARETTLHGTQG